MTSLPLPVFIVGCQRSGSTMLGSLLGGHPNVICTPESQFLVDCMPDTDPDAMIDAGGLITAIESHWRFRIWNWRLGGRRPPFQRGRYADTIAWLIHLYAEDHGRPNPLVWVEQQPGHVFHLKRLADRLPGLKAIHVVRDGRAVAASLMPLDWGPNEITTAATFWMQRLAAAYGAGQMLGPGRFVTVRFEDIVRDPARALQALASFIGLAFDPAMLRGDGLDLPAFTRGDHGLVGERPDAARSERWRDALTPRQIEIFEAMTHDLLAYHGYVRESGPRPRPAGFGEKSVMTVREQVKAVMNRLTFAKRVRLHAAASDQAAVRQTDRSSPVEASSRAMPGA